MSRYLIKDLSDRPYESWAFADESLEVISIGKCVAHLPTAEPRQDLPDGLVVFMQEAWRCLKPGGSLTIHGLAATNPAAVADPLAQRFFNGGTWIHFAKPADVDDWVWGKYGEDHGTRFDIVHEASNDTEFDVTMEKPVD